MDHEYLTNAAKALQQGQHDEALRLYTLCVEASPNNETALLQLTELSFAKGKLADANAWMNKAFTLNPTQKNLESYGIAMVKLIEAKERRARATTAQPITWQTSHKIRLNIRATR